MENIKKYGILENDILTELDDNPTIFYRNRNIANPSPYTLKMAGYKEIIYTDKIPYDINSEYLVNIYTENANTIIVTYKIIKIEICENIVI